MMISYGNGWSLQSLGSRRSLSLLSLLALLQLFVCTDYYCAANSYNNNPFNDQLMPRITERLDDFFEVPIALTQHYLKYVKRGGFVTPVDRSSIAKDLFAQTLTSQGFGLSVAIYLYFDDGMHVSAAMRKGEYSLAYRDPGYAGYDGVNIQPDDPNYKYWVACFNSTDGTPQKCRLAEGDKYVECVNDCELIPCPSSSPSSGNGTLAGNSNQSILCRNYAIKEVRIGDELGHIPFALFCTNRRGEPEQRPGFVLKNSLTNDLGNCYFQDQTTLVNHSLTGDYIACGGNGAVCDNALHGANYQHYYDQRFRPFYMSMKEHLDPIWSSPVFLIGAFYLSIGYRHPILRTSFENGRNITVFEGVTIVDYQLFHITEFLKKEYLGTEFQVIVVERQVPHYTVATSYHEVQFQLKAVLISDITKPCPDKRLQEYINNSTVNYDYDREKCDVVRIPISDMKDSKNALDVVSYRAFTAHQKENFPSDSVVHLKLTDDIGSPAFVSQGILYTLPQSDNTSWHVIAIQPLSRATTDEALPGDFSFSSICTSASLGFIGCLVLLFQFDCSRKEQPIVQADWQFTFLFMLGCAFLNLSSFTLLGKNTNPTCMLRMWAFNGLFACALSPLLVKVWRMRKLVTANNAIYHPVQVMRNCTAFLYTLPLILLELLILMIISLVDPPQQTERLGVGVGVGVGVQQITCEQQSNAFLYTQMTVYGCLIFVGCILAYKTMDINPNFGEARQIGFCFYNIAFTGVVTVATTHLIDLDQESRMILQAVAVFWASFFCSVAFVLPFLLKVDRQYDRRCVTSSTDSKISRNRYLSKRASESEMNSRFNFSALDKIQEVDEAHLDVDEDLAQACQVQKTTLNEETDEPILNVAGGVPTKPTDCMASLVKKDNALSCIQTGAESKSSISFTL